MIRGEISACDKLGDGCVCVCVHALVSSRGQKIKMR